MNNNEENKVREKHVFCHHRALIYLIIITHGAFLYLFYYAIFNTNGKHNFTYWILFASTLIVAINSIWDIITVEVVLDEKSIIYFKKGRSYKFNYEDITIIKYQHGRILISTKTVDGIAIYYQNIANYKDMIRIIEERTDSSITKKSFFYRVDSLFRKK